MRFIKRNCRQPDIGLLPGVTSNQNPLIRHVPATPTTNNYVFVGSGRIGIILEAIDRSKTPSEESASGRLLLGKKFMAPIFFTVLT